MILAVCSSYISYDTRGWKRARRASNTLATKEGGVFFTREGVASDLVVRHCGSVMYRKNIGSEQCQYISQVVLNSHNADRTLSAVEEGWAYVHSSSFFIFGLLCFFGWRSFGLVVFRLPSRRVETIAKTRTMAAHGMPGYPDTRGYSRCFQQWQRKDF